MQNNNTKRIPIIAGNWKMNIFPEDATTLSTGIIHDTQQLEVIVLPPYVYLHQVHNLLKNKSVKLGAQNVSMYSSGSYTGEISAPMLKSVNCSHAIIGHSERRQLFHEQDDAIAKEFTALVKEGIVPIVCIGETQQQRKSGNAKSIIKQQLDQILEITSSAEQLIDFIIAYEPVWAIGTGESASSELAQEMHEYIRSLCSKVSSDLADQTRIIYGGSINPENAHDLLSQQDIDGGLLGKASVSLDKFNSIIKVANTIWRQ
jgi:triosephosphate isomerase